MLLKTETFRQTQKVPDFIHATLNNPIENVIYLLTPNSFFDEANTHMLSKMCIKIRTYTYENWKLLKLNFRPTKKLTFIQDKTTMLVYSELLQFGGYLVQNITNQTPCAINMRNVGSNYDDAMLLIVKNRPHKILSRVDGRSQITCCLYVSCPFYKRRILLNKIFDPIAVNKGCNIHTCKLFHDQLQRFIQNNKSLSNFKFFEIINANNPINLYLKIDNNRLMTDVINNLHEKYFRYAIDNKIIYSQNMRSKINSKNTNTNIIAENGIVIFPLITFKNMYCLNHYVCRFLYNYKDTLCDENNNYVCDTSIYHHCFKIPILSNMSIVTKIKQRNNVKMNVMYDACESFLTLNKNLDNQAIRLLRSPIPNTITWEEIKNILHKEARLLPYYDKYNLCLWAIRKKLRPNHEIYQFIKSSFLHNSINTNNDYLSQLTKPFHFPKNKKSKLFAYDVKYPPLNINKIECSHLDLLKNIEDNEHKFIFVNGSMGAGKTQALLNYSVNFDTIYITGRRALIDEIFHRLSRVKTNNKTIYHYQYDMCHFNQVKLDYILLICVNSLEQINLDDKFIQLVLIDEFLITIDNILNLNNGQCVQLRNICNAAKKTITVDALLQQNDITHFRNMLKLQEFHCSLLHVTSSYCHMYEEIIVREPSSDLSCNHVLVDILTDVLQHKRKILIGCTQISDMIYIQDFIVRHAINWHYKMDRLPLIDLFCAHTNNESQKIHAFKLANIHAVDNALLGSHNYSELKKAAGDMISFQERAKFADVLIFNSSLAAGHSIDPPDMFYKMYMLYLIPNLKDARNTFPISQTIQMCGRLRKSISGVLDFIPIRNRINNYNYRNRNNNDCLFYEDWAIAYARDILLENIRIANMSNIELSMHFRELFTSVFPNINYSLRRYKQISVFKKSSFKLIQYKIGQSNIKHPETLFMSLVQVCYGQGKKKYIIRALPQSHFIPNFNTLYTTYVCGFKHGRFQYILDNNWFSITNV